MTTLDAQNLKIADYLLTQGCRPAKENGINLWYRSPFHEERTPSFHVNAQKNLWHDFSTGLGGDIIRLVQNLHNLNIPGTLRHLEETMAGKVAPAAVSSFQGSSSSPVSDGITDFSVSTLQHPALYQYMESRGISPEVGAAFCEEAHYSVRGVHFFALAFPSGSGGYELRNPKFKGCYGKKDFSLISHGSDNVHVVEGFFDFLSLQEMMPTIRREFHDYIVLNSVSMVKKAIPLLTSYKKVHLWLDRDQAGKVATREIKAAVPHSIDESRRYRMYNDVSAWWKNICEDKKER